MLPACQFLTVFTSESLSRTGVVQILRSSTSNSAPTMQRVSFFRRNRSRAQAWYNFQEVQLPKVLPACQFLTIFISESLSRTGVVRILLSSTSNSAPSLPVLNGFDFQIALVRRRGANFVDILGSRSFAPPRFSDLPLRSFGATEKHSILMHFVQFLPAKFFHVSHIRAIKHLCRPTSMLQDLPATFSLNFL